MKNKFGWFVLGWAVCFVIACISFGIRPDLAGKPNIADYKVAFIYRATFRPGGEGEKDFYHSVIAQIEWLKKRNYEIIKLEYVYGNDMTQNLILRYAVIKYREVKNEKE